MFSGQNCSCQSGPKLCDYENFTEIITRNGVCHQLQLEPHVQAIQLLLDPQEYDYLLPNQGVAGFRVWFHASASQALAEMQADLNDPYVKLQTLKLERRGIHPNEVVLSSEFNTIVRVAIGFERSNREGHCVTDLLQQVNVLANITANFHEDLCKLPMTDGIHIGKSLQCQRENKPTTEHSVSPEKLTQATLSISHGNQITTLNRFTSNPTEPVNVDEQLVTTQSSLMELQIVHLLFVSSSTDSQLKDVLRNYLRTLSAKRMQIRPRAGEYVSPRALSSKTSSHLLDDSNGAANAEGFPAKFSTDPCDSRLQLKLNEKYYKFLVEIGENIATCLQRLESFKSSLLGIVSANMPIINAFQISHANLSRIPHTSEKRIKHCILNNDKETCLSFIAQGPLLGLLEAPAVSLLLCGILRRILRCFKFTRGIEQ
ncbi:uncharacterized protein DEA37_0010181 [Paragonimus westermani]|uniref:Uncharacterized protein n=1 Tax=Paragonimus westermani TaxID=34504 RepID=A0A5J4NKZ9_9TREM|nr:uncharacterized protein DEA37_0010181 [Paragonimus westermani]